MKAAQSFLAMSMALSLVAGAAAPTEPTFPAHALRIAVPFTAGGPSDAVARVVGEALEKSLGQPVVVENKPEADGAIASAAVAGAAADGYTLLWGTSSALVAAAALQKSAHGADSFAPIAAVGAFTFALSVNAEIPAKTVAELVAHARQQSQPLNYATGAMGEHMAATQFMQATGIRMVRVPYKGGTALMSDLVAGRVHVNFGPLSLHLPHAKEGRLRLLAILSPQRAVAVPDVPTLAEAGVPGVSVPTWQALLAPAKTPPGVIERLAQDLQQALRDSELRTRLERHHLQIDEQATPEVLAAILRQDRQTWERFLRDKPTP